MKKNCLLTVIAILLLTSVSKGQVSQSFDTVRNVQSFGLFSKDFLIGNTENAEITLKGKDGTKALRLTATSSLTIKNNQDIKSISLVIKTEPAIEQGIELLVLAVDNININQSILLTSQTREIDKDFREVTITADKVGDFNIKFIVGGFGSIIIDNITTKKLDAEEKKLIVNREDLRKEILKQIERQANSKTIADFNKRVEEAKTNYSECLTYIPTYDANLATYDVLSKFPSVFKSRLDMADPLSYDPFKKIIEGMETIASKETAMGLAVNDFKQQFESETKDLQTTITKSRAGNTFQQVLGVGSELLNIISLGKSSSIINSLKTVASQVYSNPNVSNYVSKIAGLGTTEKKNKVAELTLEGYNNYLFMKQFFNGIEKDRTRINNWLVEINLYNESVKRAQESLDSLKLNYFLIIKKETPKNIRNFTSPSGKKEKENYQKIIGEYFNSLKIEDVKGNSITDDKLQTLTQLTTISKLLIEFESKSLSLKNRLRFSFDNFMFDFDPSYNPFATIDKPSPKTIEAKDKYDALKKKANDDLVTDFKASLEKLLK